MSPESSGSARPAAGTGVADPAVSAHLARVRAGLERVTAQQAYAAVSSGKALLIDTRTDVQRTVAGELAMPGVLVIDRTVLEWRLDPSSPWRIPEVHGPELWPIILCRQGYSSSLAAASLQTVGLPLATDVIGGVEAWAAAGLPLSRDFHPDIRR